MDRSATHRDYLEGEWQAAQAAPLSARKAMLVAMLVDAYVDRLFAATQGEDILQFRAAMADQSAALGLVMSLCAPESRLRLVLEAVAVPDAGYGALSVEDFMVSVYNDQMVQRLQLVTADLTRHDMLETLRAAIDALDAATRG